MAVARVSPGDPDTISPVTECGQNEFRTHTAGTRDPDDPEVGGILQSAHTGQICRPITTPVTQKGRYLGLPIIHYFLLMNQVLQRHLNLINHRHDLIVSKSL